MLLDSILSMRNLELAWRRINTGSNHQHKRFFRELYLIYEASLNENLKALRSKLLARAWRPNHPTRLYLPKPSGLQRPISLLGIEDQIVLQSLANIFAERLRNKHAKVALESVFSNLLSKKADSIFFFKPWHESYNAFQSKCKSLVDRGNHWVAHFDLASYYDTIAHEMLLSSLIDQQREPKTWREVINWLGVWSSVNHDTRTSHGIPQGPIASDFLAEVFFLPIDNALHKQGIGHVRYVDDIRLFAKSENEARRAGIILEQLCRERGLIPQGKKFAISYVRSLEDVLGNLPSMMLADSGERQDLEEEDAIQILRESLSGRPSRITDKTKFRFVMFRAPKSWKILKKVASLLPHHPEHIEAMTSYMGHYSKNSGLVLTIASTLKGGLPYAYPRGELWHIIARMADKKQLKSLLQIARKDATERKNTFGLSWGVMHYFIRCDSEGLCTARNRLVKEHPLSRALLSPILPNAEFAPKRVAAQMLRGTIEEQLGIVREMQRRNRALNSLGLKQSQLSTVCQNTLKELGVIQRARKSSHDWIADRLSAHHSRTYAKIWRLLLGSDYELALQIMVEADYAYWQARSTWLQLQDSFDNLVVKAFIEFLRLRKLHGGSQVTVNKKGELVTFGTLLHSNGPFAKTFPSVCAQFLRIHDRRNKLPNSHPYSQKGASPNKWLSRSERDNLSFDAGLALKSIADYVDANK